MTEFRKVTAAFSVASHLNAEDISRAAAEGFRTIVCNRPDGEAPNELSRAEAQRLTEAAGMKFLFAPFAGPPPPAVVEQTEKWLSEAPGPILAYCRSGTRCITAWALAQALAGAMTPDEILQKAAEAGYDLSLARVALQGLYPG